MALVEQESTPIASVQVHGSVESRGPLRDWFARVRSSVWSPIVLRALGITLGMLGLATIGALATARGAPGHVVADLRTSSVPGVHVEAALAAGPTGLSRRGASPTASASSETSPPKASNAVTEDGKVILNLASVEDLQRLPGVGRKRAESILALREKLGGRFKRLTDLLRIRGIGVRRLKQWTPLLVLDAPTPPPANSSRATPNRDEDHAKP